MSAGAFARSKYEADNGDIHPIRVQEETLTLNLGGANAAPTGAVDNQQRVRVSGGKRAYGIKARTVSIKFTASPPAGYKADQVLRLPILTKDIYDDIVPDVTTGTYLTVACVVVGKSGQSGRG